MYFFIWTALILFCSCNDECPQNLAQLKEKYESLLSQMTDAKDSVCHSSKQKLEEEYEILKSSYQNLESKLNSKSSEYMNELEKLENMFKRMSVQKDSLLELNEKQKKIISEIKHLPYYFSINMILDSYNNGLRILKSAYYNILNDHPHIEKPLIQMYSAADNIYRRVYHRINIFTPFVVSYAKKFGGILQKTVWGHFIEKNIHLERVKLHVGQTANKFFDFNAKYCVTPLLKYFPGLYTHTPTSIKEQITVIFYFIGTLYLYVILINLCLFWLIKPFFFLLKLIFGRSDQTPKKKKKNKTNGNTVTPLRQPLSSSSTLTPQPTPSSAKKNKKLKH